MASPPPRAVRDRVHAATLDAAAGLESARLGDCLAHALAVSNYLDGLIDQFETWECFLAGKFASQKWFSQPEQFYRGKKEGVGRDVIAAFFAPGRCPPPVLRTRACKLGPRGGSSAQALAT